MRVYYHVRRQQIVTRDRVAVSVPPARAGVPPTAQNRARVAEGQRRVQVEMQHADPPIDVQLRGCIPVAFGISGAAVEEIRPGGVIVGHKAGDGKVRGRDEIEYLLRTAI